MKFIKDNEKINPRPKENEKNDEKNETIRSEKIRYKNADKIYE